MNILRPFAKFVDLSYYSELELCGGAVTVSFSKYIPWQAMHFLQRSTHSSKTCCRPLIASKFFAYLGAPFSWLEKPRNRMERDLNWILHSAWKKWIGGTPLEHPPYSPDLAPCDIWAFSIMKRELRCKKSTVCSTFSRSGWSVVRSASLAKEGTSEKRPSPHLNIVPTRSNKVRVHELCKRPSYLMNLFVSTISITYFARQWFPKCGWRDLLRQLRSRTELIIVLKMYVSIF
jgi:hypothetical protein